MSRNISVVLCSLLAVSLISTDASAVTITSSNFSLGLGADVNTSNPNPGAWTTTETNAANTPVTTGNANTTAITVDTGFTLTPTVLGRNFSGTGPSFSGRILANGTSAVSAWSNTFDVTLQADVSSLALPPGAFDVKTTLNITQISIYAHAYNAGSFSTDPNDFHFNETTIGNIGSSPNAPTLVSLGSTTSLASNYTQLVWDPNELAVDGFSASRNFNVTGFGDGTVAYAMDGLEIFGSIQVTFEVPVPEPSSLSLLGIGFLALIQCRRRGRKTAR